MENLTLSFVKENKDKNVSYNNYGNIYFGKP